MNICPINKKLIIQTPSKKIYIISIINKRLNLLAIKKMLEDKLFIQTDQQTLSFCDEVLNYDNQSIDIYHRYYHQKYDKCIFILPIKIELKH